MKASNNTISNSIDNEVVKKFEVEKEIRLMIELIKETGELACSVRDNMHEIQKRLAFLIHNTWDLKHAARIIQSLLDHKCLRRYGKQMLANLDFIVGYYDKIEITDEGKVEIIPYNTENLKPSIVEVTFIEKALVLDWKVKPSLIGQAIYGKHKQSKFYTLLTANGSAINEYPVNDWKIKPVKAEDPTEKIMRDLKRKLGNMAENKSKLANGKHWSTIDQLLQRAHSLGIIDKYEANKPQDQRALANTSDHKGNPRIPTK